MNTMKNSVKYTCKNCGHKHTTKYINAMLKAGFALRHLACKDCGQHTISETNAEK